MSANCLTDDLYGTWMRAGLLRTVNTERGKLRKNLDSLIAKENMQKIMEWEQQPSISKKKIEKDVKKGILIPEKDEREGERIKGVGGN